MANAMMQQLNNFTGVAFAGITCVTKVKLTGGKKNVMQGRITKKTVMQVMMAKNSKSNAYENMIKRRLAAEGKDPETFTVGSLPWGERLDETPFIRHINKDNQINHYLQAIVMNVQSVEYFFDDVAIAKEDILGIPETEVNEESQGGVSNKVIIRTVNLDNITEVRFKKD